MAAKKDELKDAPLNVPSAHPDRDDAQEQARLLSEYRVTGVNRGYIDQSRDQEPDIAEDFGVAPHPELFNPKPHDDAVASGAHGGLPGIGEKQEGNLLVNPDEEVAKEARDKAVEEAQARAENLKRGDILAAGPAQPVVVVDDRSDEAKQARKDSEDK